MKNKRSAIIAKNALYSMLYEVHTTPKPGLVDTVDSGAHKDMNLGTFTKSSFSLLSTMNECYLMGIDSSNKSFTDILSNLRDIGIKGEKAMYKATGGVNTQKGIIFALGILTSAIGRVQSSFMDFNIDNVINTIKEMTKGIVDRELGILKREKIKDKLTAGETLYIKYGSPGIRGEVESGFPSVINYGLPTLLSSLKKGLNLNDAAVNTILNLMTVVEDTTVLWRRGKEGLNYMKTEAKNALALGGIASKEGKRAIIKMNEGFIKKNISPGGCADLLAVTIMFYLTFKEELINEYNIDKELLLSNISILGKMSVD